MRRSVIWKCRKGIWYYRLADEITFHSTGLRDKDAAEREIFQNPGKRLGEEKRPRADMTTLRQFAGGFFEWESCGWIKKQHALGRPFERGTADMRRGHMLTHILPVFGDQQLARITKHAIQAWLVSLELSNQSRNHIMYTMRIILREAKDAGLIKENPLLEPEAFGKSYRARDAFSVAELGALFPADPRALERIWWSHEAGVIFLLMAGAGLRSGEARALQWRQLLWAEEGLLVDRTIKGEGKKLAFGPIDEKKGGARIELVPRRILRELGTWRKRALFTEPEDLVFPGEDRAIPLTKKTLSRRLCSAIRRVNVAALKKKLPEPFQVGARNLVVHSFRHTYVTRLRRLVSQELLQQLTGHHSIAMTDHYDHPQIEERIAALAPARLAIEGLWS